MGKVLFFGYGANRSSNKLRTLLNRDLGDSVGAVIEGYCLGIQTLKQIPEEISTTLKSIYGEDFKAYTLKKGRGMVTGSLWEITTDEIETIKNWEFVGPWREMIEVEVISSGLKPIKAFTEKAIELQEVDHIVDGLLYQEFNLQRINQNKPSDDPFYTQTQIEKIRGWLKSQ